MLESSHQQKKGNRGMLKELKKVYKESLELSDAERDKKYDLWIEERKLKQTVYNELKKGRSIFLKVWSLVVWGFVVIAWVSMIPGFQERLNYVSRMFQALSL